MPRLEGVAQGDAGWVCVGKASRASLQIEVVGAHLNDWGACSVTLQESAEEIQTKTSILGERATLNKRFLTIK